MTGIDESRNQKGNSDRIFETTGRSAPEHPDDVMNAAVEAASLIDPIESARVTDDPDELWLAKDRRIPGFGSLAENCGDAFARFCPDCGGVTEWGQTCYESHCPRCAPAWARRLSVSYCSQLEQIRRVRQSNRDDHQRFHHVAISPPADWHPEAKDPSEKWKKGAEVVKKMLEAADLEGLIIFHPYRGKGEEDDRGEWKRRLFDEKDWGEVRDELKFSPHYHAVVVGHKVPGGDVTRAIEGTTGWVLKRITKKESNVSIYDEYDLARVVSYCLSHAGLYETEHQTRVCEKRIGKMNYGKSPKWEPDEDEDDDRLRKQYDAVVRSVAPKTLGLDYNDMACSERISEDDGDEDEDEKCDLDHAEGAARGFRSTSQSTSDGDGLSEAPAGELPNESPESGGDLREVVDDLPDRVAATTDDLDSETLRSLSDDELPAGIEADEVAGLLAEEKTRCNGRLLSIARASSYLHDPQWCRKVPHADELQEAWEKWSERLDWVG